LLLCFGFTGANLQRAVPFPLFYFKLYSFSFVFISGALFHIGTLWFCLCSSFGCLQVQTSRAGYHFFTTADTATQVCQWPLAKPTDNASISRAAFGAAIDSLGLTGEGSIGLLENEVDAIYKK
jgi:hypothetical protein